MLLVSSLILIATMPVITKKKHHTSDYKYGPPGGWVCLRSMMPCKFTPPAKTGNYAIYYNDSKIPSFSAPALGELIINPAPAKEGDTGCKSMPDLNRYQQDYTEGKVILKGSFCTTAKLVRIVY